MTLAINTGDALAASLTRLFAVDTDGVIKEIKTGAALTPHANVIVNGTTAPFGRSFRTSGDVPPGAGTTTYGVDFTAFLASNAAPVSVFIVANKFNDSNGNSVSSRALFGNDTAASRVGTQIQYDATTGKFTHHNQNGSVALSSLRLTTGTINSGAHSFGFTRQSTGSSTIVKCFIDGAVDANFTGGVTSSSQFGAEWATAEMGYIGGFPGSSWASFDYVYIAVFVGATLTEADFTRLHASLTGGGNFALVTGAAPALSLSGSITISSVGNASFTADWPAATGGTSPYSYEYSVNGGTSWTPWATNTRNLSGLTPGALIDFRVRALDAAASVSSALTASVQLSAAADAAPTFSTHPQSGTYTEGQTATLTWAVSGNPTPTVQLQRSTNGGTSWADIASSGSSYTTPVLAVGDNGVRYRARAMNTIASTPNTVYSNEATLAVNAASGSGTLTVTGIKNGSGTLLASTTLPNVVVIQRNSRAALLALTSQTTNGAGTLTITSGALAAGVACQVVAFSDDGTLAGSWPATVV